VSTERVIQLVREEAISNQILSAPVSEVAVPVCLEARTISGPTVLATKLQAVLALCHRQIILVLELIFGEELWNCGRCAQARDQGADGVALRNAFGPRVGEIGQAANVTDLRLR